MQIDSVRELKARLSPIFLTPLASPAKISAEAVAMSRPQAPINLAAQSLSVVEPVQRTVALGIARKGKNNFKLAVRVQRRAFEEEEYVAKVRKAAKGEIDVRYVGRIVKRAVPWYQKRSRPIRPGCSIGHFRITAGTLGCFVQSPSGVLYIISNNHVLANENRSRKGDAIIQPGAYDGGSDPADRIGLLERSIRLRVSTVNLMDAATCTIEKGVTHDPRVKNAGRIKGLFAGPLADGIAVRKLGRTTGLTEGRITAFELDNVVVRYDLGNLRFDDQIEIEGRGTTAFSDGGDSGSLVFNDDMEGVGLLFAGGDQGGTNGLGLTYANPLGTVLTKLRVTLA